MDYRFNIALIYDFDGTLAPGNMQEYDFIPAVGKSNKEFWTEANTLAEEQDADMVLTYMARMLQEAKSKGLSLRREAFQESGRRVTLYKGVESVFDSKLVNRYIPENERPIPFKHMIYVGDGTTDIPCMRLVKNPAGHSIAVYNPDQKGARREMASLIHDNRVSHVCPADYSEGSDMDVLVKTIIDKIDLDDKLEKLEVVK